MTQRLPSFETYSGFEVTLTIRFVSGSTLRSIWQPTPQNVQVVFVCSSAALLDARLPRGTSRRSRRSGRRRGSRRRARTRCRARSAPRSARSAPPARGPRARARSTASPPACSGRSGCRGCTCRARSPSAGCGPRTARASRRGGRAAPRRRARAARSTSSFGRPPGLAFRCSERSISVSVFWSCGTCELVETTMPSATRVAQAGSGRGDALDADDAHPAAAVGVELVVVAERGDEDAVAGGRVKEQLAFLGARRAAVEGELDHAVAGSRDGAARAGRRAPASARTRSAPGTAPPGRARRSRSASSRRAILPPARATSRRARARAPRRRGGARGCRSGTGVHFWHDSSAKKRIVSASRRSGEYDAGKTWTAAEPTPQPHSVSASRVSGTSSAAGGRIPLAAPPGTIAPGSSVKPPA